MAKSKEEKQGRPDSERRIRQCEKFAKLLQLLRVLLGRGRWNARALAQELDCSVRTVHRYLNVLTMSGVPISFDRTTEAYTIHPHYRFPRFDQVPLLAPDQQSLHALLATARRSVHEIEDLAAQLRSLCEQLETAAAEQKIDSAVRPK